jgi:putative FmdB family regulatory protein
MPIFEYVCQSCGTKFEKLVFSSRQKKGVRCPHCGAEDVNKAFSVFGSTTGSSTGAASAAPNCGPSG